MDNQEICVYCPNCGKLLFRCAADTNGIIMPYCKRCKREVRIELRIEPKSHYSDEV